MKAGQEHRVPPSPRALQILADMGEVRQNDYIFPGCRRPTLTGHVLLETLRRLGQEKATVHGMRSAFRVWCSEQTNFPREICEAALAHSNGNKVEAAYNRTDVFEKRRKLMNAWATFCARPPQQESAPIIPINKAGAA
jgi:integrase